MYYPYRATQIRSQWPMHLQLGKETLPLTRWLSPEDLIAGEHLDYRNVFRVLIVQFMDAQNLDIRALKKSCVHMVRPNGTMIPFGPLICFIAVSANEPLTLSAKKLRTGQKKESCQNPAEKSAFRKR